MPKNIINRIAIFAILLVSYFGMNLEEGKGKAPCETGFTFTNMIINVNGCLYSVPVCYKCSPTALTATIVKLGAGPITPLDTNCTQTWDYEFIFADIMQQVRNRIYLSELCEVKPCILNPKVRMLFVVYSCWEKLSNQSIVACTSDAYCETLYEACNNGSTIVWNTISGNLVGTPLCPSMPTPPNLPKGGGCYLLNPNCP